MVKQFLFPMKDYVGEFLCGLFMIFVDIFVRFHALFLPALIALLRYLFIVKSDWLKSVGVSTVVNVVIATQVLAPAAITLILQFPTFDFMQGPYNHCIGRFEVYFNPTHPGDL